MTLIGKILNNRYEILEKIGTGGMGDVYKAHCSRLNRIVAIKILKPEFNDNNNFLRKFERESLAGASISDPHIVGIYDVGSEKVDETLIYYIVMEYINGKTLKELIKNQIQIPEKKALMYTLQIAEALKVAHDHKIIHRDIKPQNIMITKSDRIKVTDFGIARIADNSTVTITNNIMGSVHYFSPEQAKGSLIDNRTDIYSLGIILFEMLTGKLPFDADNPVTVALMQVQNSMPLPSSIVNSISSEIDNLVMKMTMKNPNDRYKNIQNVIKDIKSILNGDKISLYDTNNGFETQSKESTMPLNKDNIKNNINKRQKKIIRRNKNNNYDAYNPKIEDINPNRPKNKKKKSRSGFFFSILGVLCAIFLVYLIIIIAPKALSGFNIPKLDKTKVVVPNIIGKTDDDAKKILKDNNLKMNVIDNKENFKYKDREVLSQSPETGTKVKEDSLVDVVVNVLPGSSKVPNLVGLTLSEAQNQIKDTDFKIINIKSEYSDDVKEGKIIEQDPKAGKDVISNKNITIIISKGKDLTPKTIENLVGRPQSEAEKVLMKNGFKIKIIEKPSEKVEKGEVSDYFPKGSAPKGSEITLIISSDKIDKDKKNKFENFDEDTNKKSNSKHSLNKYNKKTNKFFSKENRSKTLEDEFN